MWKILTPIVRLPGRRLVFLALLVFASLSTACSDTVETAAPTLMPSELHEVGPIFREFYRYLGGKAVLGPTISDVFGEDARLVQYTETAKMVFDPQSPADQRFTLAPLGKSIVFNEPPVPTPANPGIPYIEGHTIAAEFLPLYEKLGPWVVGRPLTELRYNPNRKRYEQYFENVGFYRLKGSNEVHLLAYGVILCDQRCRSDDPQNAQIDIDHYIDPTFQQFVNQMGADFTGFALDDARVASDGKWEQVLENVILIADAQGRPETVSLRPLARDLHILTDPPKPYSGDPAMHFVVVSNDSNGQLGYEVPVYFWDFIEKHGGLAVVGEPATQLARRDSQTYTQCFMNLCLKYDLSTSASVQVRPDPIGYAYLVLRYPPNLEQQARPGAVIVTPLQQVTAVQVWEAYPALDARFQQEIGVLVRTNGQPAPGVTAILVLIMPDGSQITYTFPPTGNDGKSLLRLPPLQAANSSLFQYKVCVPGMGRDTFCVEDSFVIWNNP